jgi:hypothetical protein
MFGHGGPELGKGIAAHPSGEPQSGSQAGVAHAGLAFLSPGIREEIVAGNAKVSGKGGSHRSVGLACHESHHHGILDPSFDGLARGAEIPWVFAPKGPESGLHGVAGGNSGKAHSLSLAVSLPMGAVLARTIKGRTKARREQAGGQAFRTDSAMDKPVQPLPAGDGLVRNGSIPECLRRWLMADLTRGSSGNEK